MFAVVVGDFKKSELIIQDLKDNGYGVEFIDSSKAGEITEKCLKEKGGELAKLFVALTEDDYTNLFICKLAKKVFKAEKTIALANYPDNIELMEAQDIDNVICANLFIKDSVEDILLRGERECI